MPVSKIENKIILCNTCYYFKYQILVEFELNYRTPKRVITRKFLYSLAIQLFTALKFFP
jgi:hypothetical protein